LKDGVFQYARIAVVGGIGTIGPLLVSGGSFSGSLIGLADRSIGSTGGGSGSFCNFVSSARRLACNWRRDFSMR
jgi:hypothetical protein